MHISVLGWDGPMATVTVLLIILALGYVLGVWRTRKTGGIAQRKLIRSKWAAVNGMHQAAEDHQIKLNDREHDMNFREDVLDERDRDLAGYEVDLSHRELAVSLRELATAAEPARVDDATMNVA